MRTVVLLVGAAALIGSLVGMLPAQQRQPQQPPAAAPANRPEVLRGCLVSPLDEVTVPAQEPGVLIHFEAKEGREVFKETELGQIDDNQPQAQKLERISDYEAARLQAESEIEVEYSEANALVAEAELQQAEAVNKRVPNSVTNAELRRLILALERARLQTQKARHDKEVNLLLAKAKSARVQEVEGIIARRKIIAPIDGMIVKVDKHRGEWVNPGDMVLKIVRMDRLKVEGFLNAADFAANEVSAKPVTIRVGLARGRVAEFPGKIVTVSREVQAGGKFRVWAEVENRRENDHWLLGPGLQAEMTIHVGGIASNTAASEEIAANP